MPLSFDLIILRITVDRAKSIIRFLGEILNFSLVQSVDIYIINTITPPKKTKTKRQKNHEPARDIANKEIATVVKARRILIKTGCEPEIINLKDLRRAM